MVKRKIEPNEIANKMRRNLTVEQRKIEKKKKRKEHRQKLKRGEIEKQNPNTQENMRILTDDLIIEKDEDLNEEENFDEFSQFIKSLKTPKIFITSNLKPTRFTFDFLIELKNLLPNAHYYPRNKQTLDKICKAAQTENFTHLLVLNERLKKPWSISFTILGTGPTLQFRVRKYVPTYEIFNKGNPTDHYPELILKNFNTALGRRVGRAIGSLFPSQPEFKGRTVVTFHNQRDFIFFRHHRYIFKKQDEPKSEDIKDKVQVNLQEIGPRFVLQLQKIYQSNFNEFKGEHEFLYRADYYVKHMRTVIRMQNKFHRNNYISKIVVQGGNQNLRGRFIQHIGWWIPRPTQNQPRSILVNKYRARYWIGIGAQFNSKVQRCFSFLGMAQSPWISFGSKTLYKEPKEEKHERWKKGLNYFMKKTHGMVQNELYSDENIKLIQAQYFRKFKLEENLGDYLNSEINVDDLLGESLQKTNSDNVVVRTEKYKILKKFYDSVEQGKAFIDEHKKQILFDKLKELFQQGVYIGQEDQNVIQIKGQNYSYKDLEEIFRQQYEILKKNRIVKTELFKKQFVPITQEEAQQLFMKYQRMNLRTAIKKVREIFEKAKENNKTVLRFHIIGQIKNEQTLKDIRDVEKEGYENIVIDDVMKPEFSLITPPDTEEYNPEDWYDLRNNMYSDLTPASKDHSRLLDRPKTRAYLQYKERQEREQMKLVDPDDKKFQEEIPDFMLQTFHDVFKEENDDFKKRTVF